MLISPNNIFTMKTKMVIPPPGFSRNLICIVNVGGEELNTLVMKFAVAGERNLSRPYRNVRSESKCKEIPALVTLYY